MILAENNAPAYATGRSKMSREKASGETGIKRSVPSTKVGSPVFSNC